MAGAGDSLKQVMKNAFLPHRQSDAERNLKDEALLGFPQFTTLSSYPFDLPRFLHSFLLFIKPSIKMFRFNCPFNGHFSFKCYTDD